jgi:hypothetical protein
MRLRTGEGGAREALLRYCFSESVEIRPFSLPGLS